MISGRMGTLIYHEEPLQRQALEKLLERAGIRGVTAVSRYAQGISLLKSSAKFRWILMGNENRRACSEIETALEKLPHHIDTCLIQIHQRSLVRKPSLEDSRTDAICTAPMGPRKLHHKFSRAYRARLAHRDLLLWPSSQPPPTALLQALEKGAGHWQAVQWVRTNAALQHFLLTHSHRVGAMIVGSDFGDANAARWLKRFKRVAANANILVVGIGNVPGELSCFRTVCDFFVPHTEQNKNSPSPWRGLLSQLSARLINSWVFAEHAGELRKALACDDLKSARKFLAGLKGDETRLFEYHYWSGELLLRMGKTQPTIHEFMKAMNLNPFHPRPYTVLLPLLAKREDPALFHEMLKRAQNCCPRHPTIHELIERYECY